MMAIDPKAWADYEGKVLGMLHETREQVACLDMICKILAAEMVASKPDPHAYVDELAPRILGISEKLAEVSTPATQQFLEAFVARLETFAGPRKSP